ncbi:hypothetical protein [Pseudomonas extremaustralis]|uniref:Prophage PSSB64-02 n=1 Tax=Pseudomonas extremaustralis TaxID=359110 RepID=A0A5C5QBW1_9PSED|nr:hypothetical protein [Pseudomonas extremaustralis]EZI26391.1 hypothetical protein PE143B_0121645 [Pseudomonas extremaustralis 14-3 substr. 14-3b]TWS01621.1 hypothetical protein FIV36_23585 [Pseudomonas extremaustralis]SDE61414.1 hypothetical protein SAMN05216591_0380 [Pseudomonas extremaustralis]
MTDKISVNCRSMLTEAITRMSKMFEDKHFVVVSLRPGKDRTLDQNRLWFAMYKRIAEMTQIGEPEDARRYCKLHFGVQILLNEDAGFQAEWYRVMRHLPYETKLAMMGECHLFGPDGFPVTSLFNRAQGVQYTDRMANYFTGQGVVFTDLLSKEAA